MLPRAERLTSKEFAQAFAAGKTARHPLLSVRVLRHLAHENAAGSGKTSKISTRAAFVVPKKQAKAAKRNRLRRRMRECYRRHPALAQWMSALEGCDLIFVASSETHKASFEELNAAFAQLLRRAARLASDSVSERASEKALLEG
jgi:ribonuclease P protein component